MWGVILNVLTRRVQWYVQFMSKRALSALSAWRALKINFSEHGYVGCHFEGLGKESSTVCAICQKFAKTFQTNLQKFAKYLQKISKKFAKIRKKFAKNFKKICKNSQRICDKFEKFAKAQRY